MTDAGSAHWDRLSAELHEVISQAQTLLSAGQSGGVSVEARERLRARLGEVAAQLDDWQAAARIRARSAGLVAEDPVHEEPWPMVGLAASAGMLVGLLFGRR